LKVYMVRIGADARRAATRAEELFSPGLADFLQRIPSLFTKADRARPGIAERLKRRCENFTKRQSL